MRKTLLPLAALVLLAACSGSDEPEAVVSNEPAMLDVTNEAADVPEAPLATPSINLATENSALVEEPEPTAPDEQVLEDADATGMTARVDRSGDEETAPAETVSEKKD
ncbi:hypothetical protein SAMN06297144_1715 [Sphingomonas guangdongensis]|uniref:Uncharacterized protein n=1 Tax=Sphingomonas guangdongensis TaxID=1141890 RepID=A0A285QYR5_9SPHN|nr:hypothetical protein [Sphingomonas guangdongensis]SOB86608.1 hypothetical protein SAMN06297144_1715 [Sphingomonas guangdongensis]